MTKPIPHGTKNAYNNYGCRCDECKAASSRYMAERYKVSCAGGCGRLVWHIPSRPRTGLCPVCLGLARREDRHGTEGIYKRCKCDVCRAAAAAARRVRRRFAEPKVHNRNGYTNGCRCAVCREAHRVYAANRRKSVKAAA